MLTVAEGRYLHADQSCRRLVVRELFVLNESREFFVIRVVKKVNVFGQHELGWKNNLVKFAPEKRQSTMAFIEDSVWSNCVDDDVVCFLLTVERDCFVRDVEIGDFC